MRAFYVLAFGILGLGLCQGQAEASNRFNAKDPTAPKPSPFDPTLSPGDRARIPEPYLSIGEVSAHRDPDAQPPRIRVAGYYHNYTRQTVTGATFSIDRWTGTSWQSVKNGPLNAILANKDGAESVSLPFSNEAMKFRFVISKSVEGSKEVQLAAGPASANSHTKSNMKNKAVPILQGDWTKATSQENRLNVKDKLTPNQTNDKASSLLDESNISPLTKAVPDFKRNNAHPFPYEFNTSPDARARIADPYLSIDRFLAGRSARGIFVRAELSNNNMGPVSGATYTIERWNGTGWTTLKSDTLATVPARGSTPVSAELPTAYDAMKFRLKVSKSVEGMKECSLPELVFVVKYRCPEWTVYQRFDQDANYLSRHSPLNDLGFETRVQDTYHDNFFSSYHTITLSYRCVNLQERSFPTPAAAKAFQASLPTEGVLTNIVER